ncbi:MULTISPECIES: hypothetical protein [unclassified Streptomyces]|uniref:hypothetical protein n=1 Tax=unclassified Streptomyces TaxID=2593676 RepID=UPI0033D88690
MSKRKSKKHTKNTKKTGEPEQVARESSREAADNAPQARITAMDPAGPSFSGVNTRR